MARVTVAVTIRINDEVRGKARSSEVTESVDVDPAYPAFMAEVARLAVLELGEIIERRIAATYGGQPDGPSPW
jgi:hypothetical protein